MIAIGVREAIISGRVAQVGDRYADAQALKIIEGEVVLLTGCCSAQASRTLSPELAAFVEARLAS
jgi:hypothetical protein